MVSGAADYKCNAEQSVIDRVARSIKSQAPFRITCNDGSTLSGAKCASTMFGQGSSSQHTCLNVGSLGSKVLKYVINSCGVVIFFVFCVAVHHSLIIGARGKIPNIRQFFMKKSK